MVNQNSAQRGGDCRGVPAGSSTARWWSASERYGKGTVQQLVPLESGRSLLKLTWASFWRPSGAKIHRAVDGKEDETWGVVPDAGYERKLSADEYAAYRKYRSQRDVLRPNKRRAEPPTMMKSRVPADFVDEPLRMAVEHLQQARNGLGT